ncbi:fibroblast growth factor 2 isoform X2 [Ursus arctos]|nr:fibroblast growth factor 2 isoform X2 [Ursus arctos]
MWLGWRRVGLGRLLGNLAGVEPLELRRPLRSPPRSPSAPPPPPAAFGLPPGPMSRACVLRPKLPTRRPAPKSPERVGGGAQEGRRAGGVGEWWWVFGGGDVEDVTPRPGRCQTSGRGARGCCRIPGAAARAGGLLRAAAAETPSPKPQLPSPAAHRALGQPESGEAERLEAGGPRARSRAAGREAGGPGTWPCPGPGRGPGPGGGGSPRGSRGAGTPAEPRWGHGSREHHHAARPAGGRRQRRLPARPLQGPQTAVLQKRGLLPAHPPRRPSGRGPGEERPSYQTATSSGRERGCVHQRSMCKSLSCHEGRWKITGF